jgi:hypothetical protein
MGRGACVSTDAGPTRGRPHSRVEYAPDDEVPARVHAIVVDSHAKH